jgi:hypothetical protein
MTRELSRKLHEAKARKRMALPSPEYPALLDYENPVVEITIKLFRNGNFHTFTLFHCRKRKDMWRVVMDGKEWRKAIGYSALMASIRKFSNPNCH